MSLRIEQSDHLAELRKTFRNRRFLIVVGSLAVLGGAERQALLLAEFLKRQMGIDITLLGTFPGNVIPEKLDALDIPHCVVSLGEYRHPRQKILDICRAILVIRRLAPDVIIPFMSYNSKILGTIWKLTGAKYALWNQRDEGRRVYGTSLERFALRNVCDIVSNSYAGRDALVEKCGVRPEDVTIINNGVVIPDKSKLRPVWREKLGLPPNTLLVSMIANLTPYKDHPTLLKAWKIVEERFAKDNQPVALILAGNPRVTGDELKVLAFDLRLRSVYMPGRVDDVHTLINDCDLIVHSSKFEGCPNGVLEAMALGKPVVGTDISGIRQALGKAVDDHCLAVQENPPDLAGKIRALLRSAPLQQHLGHINRERIRSVFSIRGMAESYMGLIKKRWDAVSMTQNGGQGE